MTAVLQRIKKGSVRVDGEITGRAEAGLFILLGVAAGDTREDADALAAKIKKLRIFNDDAGKMNLSVADIGGDMLIVSNFTLLANYRQGNRPDYLGAASPALACELYKYFLDIMSSSPEVRHVGAGVFGAHMEIETQCDGPVTIVMDSSVLRKNIK